MEKINNEYALVPALWPKGQTGAVSSDIISLKNYNVAAVFISVGASPGGTIAVTMDQGPLVSSATVALGFTRYFRTGFKVNHGGASNSLGFTVGETVTGGTSGGTGVVVLDTGSTLWMHTSNGTAFSSGETMTGGTSAYTATSSSVSLNEDAMLEATAASNTFTIPAVANKQYVIPIEGSMLTEPNDCIELEMAAPSAGTVTYGAHWILGEARFVGTPMPTAIYD